MDESGAQLPVSIFCPFRCLFLPLLNAYPVTPLIKQINCRLRETVPGPPLHAAVDSFCAHALFAWWRSGQGIGLATLNVASSNPGLALSGNNLGQDCSGSVILYIFFISTENISVL